MRYGRTLGWAGVGANGEGWGSGGGLEAGRPLIRPF